MLIINYLIYFNIGFLKAMLKIEMTENTKNTGMTLLLPEEYFTKALIKRGTTEIYKTLTVKPGTIVFRGDFTEKKIPSGKYPVFFWR